MNKIVPFLLLLILSKKVIANKDSINHFIGVIEYSPFVIQTKGIVFGFNNVDTFRIGSGRLILNSFSRNKIIEFDHLIQLKAPLSTKERKWIIAEFNQGLNKKNQISIDLNEKDNKILDTLMEPGHIITVFWLSTRNKIYQRMVFKCENLVPKLSGYRNFKNNDSIDQIHKARQFVKLNFLTDGFIQQEGKNLQLIADNNMELRFVKPDLLLDSSIKYRLLKLDNKLNQNWIKAGHLVTLSKLKPNSTYILEIKYSGQSETNRIEINTKKRFYQELWFILLYIFSIICFIFFTTKWYYRRKIRQLTIQRNRIEEQLKMIQSQLNPHFVFNALSSIEGLVSTGQNDLANEYLTNFSSILRETLKNANRIFISLEEELLFIDKYCKVEQLRFGFSYIIEVDEVISTAELELPPMLLQPIIENAIKHGLSSMKKKGSLKIDIAKAGVDLVILISNNRNLNKNRVVTAGGYGLKYTETRINHFNQLNPQNTIIYKLDMHDTHTISTLRFKNWFL
ncbi:MAG: hypothetical protein B7Y37_14080 [Sphingobacteriia bacterium 28-36-52]|nr:MAG: hypothetical protein B7Y37_14080 [Sphingobacteriia bacterium 28-36-52]